MFTFIKKIIISFKTKLNLKIAKNDYLLTNEISNFILEYKNDFLFASEPFRSNKNIRRYIYLFKNKNNQIDDTIKISLSQKFEDGNCLLYKPIDLINIPTLVSIYFNGTIVLKFTLTFSGLFLFKDITNITSINRFSLVKRLCLLKLIKDNQNV